MSKLPAPQPTRPMKMSEFWLMKLFCEQKLVKHCIESYGQRVFLRAGLRAVL